MTLKTEKTTRNVVFTKPSWKAIFAFAEGLFAEVRHTCDDCDKDEWASGDDHRNRKWRFGPATIFRVSANEKNMLNISYY